MSKKNDDALRDAAPRPCAPGLGYYLPEHAQYELVRLQELLGFLSRLAAPRTAQDDLAGSLTVTPSEMSHFLQLLAAQVTPVLEELEGPAHVALTYVEPRH